MKGMTQTFAPLTQKVLMDLMFVEAKVQDFKRFFLHFKICSMKAYHR